LCHFFGFAVVGYYAWEICMRTVLCFLVIYFTIYKFVLLLSFWQLSYFGFWEF
jgi:hypothetical protein